MTSSTTSGVRRPFRWAPLILVCLAVAAACSGSDDGDDGAVRDPEPAATLTAGPLTVKLSTGEAAPAEADPVAVVEGEPIDEAAIDALLDSVPPWTVPEGLTEEFNRPAESLPPPLTGATIDAPFPAGTELPPPAVETGPLEVLRFQPEGDVPVAPSVSVTFNQPMVPLATLDQLDTEDPPVTITPDLPGRWQWIGTRTLRFDYESDLVDRMPMATEYTVEIPAGTESESGQTLADAVSWQFTTPPPQLQQLVPTSESLPLEPIFLATFDQRIDPEAVLGATTVKAGDEEREVRLATRAEIEADETVGPAAESAVEGRWLAFRAVDAFEPDSTIDITFGPGVPSAEGPRTTTDARTTTVRTYPPLAVDEHSCTGSDRCEPGRSLWTTFTNPLDLEVFDPSLVTAAPDLAGQWVTARSDRSIEVYGDTQGETTYDVTFDASLQDVYGQTLGEDVTVSFDIRAARPSLEQLDDRLVTLDPMADTPTLPISTVGHDELRVRSFAVDPATDWATYDDLYDQYQSGDDNDPAVPWPATVDEVVPTGAQGGERMEVPIDLRGVIPGDSGHAVVVIEPTGDLADLTTEDENYWSNRPVMVWVQSTQIGLDAYIDQEELVAWATSLTTGEPLAGVAVGPVGGAGAATDESGLATVALSNTALTNLLATQGDDSALLPTSHISERSTTDQVLWYVFDDRAMYRPGETVHLKGWVRVLQGTDHQLGLYQGPMEIPWKVRDPYGNEIADGTATLSELGGLDLSFDLPEGANLGDAMVELTATLADQPVTYNHGFQIQEFRRPEFEVDTQAETEAPYFVDQPASASVTATYYSGGPLPDAETGWSVFTSDAIYEPPGWDDFTFGEWQPWWLEDSYGAEYGEFGPSASGPADIGPMPPIGPDGEPEVETFSARTDGAGRHVLEMAFNGDGEGLPTTVTAEATVTDVNRQAWSSRTDFLVHPGELYVGLRSRQSYVEPGDDLVIDAIVTDIDGEAVADRAFTVEASRLEWQEVDGEWTEVPVDTETCDEQSAGEPVECQFSTDTPGTYQITAKVVDDAGRTSRTELTTWVRGGRPIPSRGVEQETVELIPDAEEYAPGDVAEILVQAPFSTGTGLLTVTRGDRISSETFAVEESSAVVQVPIADEHIPNLHVQVDVVGATDRTDVNGDPVADLPLRPAYATGQIDLAVPPVSRTLDVSAVPRHTTVAPGGETTLDVTVLDAGGAPVADAELAVVVVDEAVLALTGYELLDPLSVFYQPVQSESWAEYGRSLLRLLDIDELAAQARLSGLSPDDADSLWDADGRGLPEAASPTAGEESADSAVSYNASSGSEGTQPISPRTDFDPLAVFEPAVTTGADGTATVEVPMPDNLTRYRVMVVAVDGTSDFGTAESNITARLPLMVRPSAPRFLNFGDTFELPVVVQNQTDEAMDVDVVVETANLELTGDAGQRVTVPPNERVEVRFPAASDAVGTATFRATARSGDDGDSSVVSLPVYTPATSEAFATYGVVDEGAIVQPITAPEGVFPQFGGLEVDTSSTALQALTDAVLYVYEYDYESADAYASRILAVVALRDVLDAFQADGLPPADDLNAGVAHDIDALVQLQQPDGGFRAWSTSWPSDPFVSVEAVQALVMARDEGYPVASSPIDQGLSYLHNIKNNFPADYPQALRDTVEAYALNVRAQAGSRATAEALALYDRAGDTLGLDGLAWLWPVLDDEAARAEILLKFNNNVTETAGAATFSTDYGDDAYLILYSDRRTDGIILDALITQAPDSDLIPKVVAGLLGNQTQGRWDNIQENTFILLALKRYFDTFEAQTPDFVARIWLGDLYAGEHTYAGRTTDRGSTNVSMGELIEGGSDDLIVAKDGPGRLYYRLGLRYAPDDLDLDPLDRGFVVQRTYEAVDDLEDVARDADGVWHIAAGAKVRVQLSMVADSRRTHALLLDPFAAGLEPLNPALAVSETVLPPAEESEGSEEFEDSDGISRPSFPWWQWWEHQNLRDDRAEAYTSLLSAGTYEYTYVARATTPGRFIVPPARAEQIYEPDTFGRSGSDVVVVE